MSSSRMYPSRFVSHADCVLAPNSPRSTGAANVWAESRMKPHCVWLVPFKSAAVMLP